MYLKTVTTEERDEQFIEYLLSIWEKAVRKTHLFLTEEAIVEIKRYVPSAIMSVPILIIAVNNDGKTVAFIGLAGKRLEMLFITPEEIGKGLGRRLLSYAVKQYGVSELTVNEQNPNAVGFYEHMGFRT